MRFDTKDRFKERLGGPRGSTERLHFRAGISRDREKVVKGAWLAPAYYLQTSESVLMTVNR